MLKSTPETLIRIVEEAEVLQVKDTRVLEQQEHEYDTELGVADGGAGQGEAGGAGTLDHGRTVRPRPVRRMSINVTHATDFLSGVAAGDGDSVGTITVEPEMNINKGRPRRVSRSKSQERRASRRRSGQDHVWFGAGRGKVEAR